MEKTISKKVTIPLGIVCIAGALVLLYVGGTLAFGGNMTISKVPKS